MNNWAVFMDRDGTINQDVGYLDDPGKLRLLPGAVEAVKLLNEAGAKVIVVSNQSGVARGFFSEEAVNRVNQRLKEKLSAKGAVIDAFYFCPHHSEVGEEPYRADCQCRKPRPGLLLRAAEEHDIDLSRSYKIGDRMSDIEAGVNAGCRTILVLTGEGQQALLSRDEWNMSPDYVARDIHEAARWIINDSFTEERNRI